MNAFAEVGFEPDRQLVVSGHRHWRSNDAVRQAAKVHIDWVHRPTNLPDSLVVATTREIVFADRSRAVRLTNLPSVEKRRNLEAFPKCGDGKGANREFPVRNVAGSRRKAAT